MNEKTISELFDVRGQVAVVTGGAGILCGAICEALAAAGAKVAILDIDLKLAQGLAAKICSAGGEAIAVPCNVLDKGSVQAAARTVLESFGRVDILVDGAGGNSPAATTGSDQPFFNLLPEALRAVIDLNLMGTILPAQVFGKLMASRKRGVILNVASMNAIRPLTRIPGYSAAKAGVANFTQWLAVHMAQEYSPEIRVNAIAPGFFLTEQNRFLLTNRQDGALTERGRAILEHTPKNRFGTPEDLLGTVLWLVSPASAFVTGIVIPIDGGFSAYSGV